MSTSPSPASGRLASLGVLRFTGPDAASFLQGQLSNDTTRLSTGEHALLAAYSSAQGRVVAVMTLVPHSGGILAVLPLELLAPTAERLRKFVLRAKVKIDAPGDELCVAGQHGAEALSSAGMPLPQGLDAYREHDAIGIARRGSSQRYYVFGPAARLRALDLIGDENDSQLIDNAWRLAEIRDGRPQVYAQTTEEFVAQMLNLDVLDGISFKKGCYTGQEIIARTQHLGRIKRRMSRVQLPAGAWSVGAPLTLTDGRGGRLVEIAEVAGNGDDIAVEALAVLTLEATAEKVVSAGPEFAAIELSLPYGVAMPADARATQPA